MKKTLNSIKSVLKLEAVLTKELLTIVICSNLLLTNLFMQGMTVFINTYQQSSFPFKIVFILSFIFNLWFSLVTVVRIINYCKRKMKTLPKTVDYNLFLDDERVPLDCATYMSSFKVDCKIYHQPWEIVRSYSQFKEIIEKRGLPELISFDHDLADNWKLRESLDSKEWFDEKENREYTGMDCAKWLTQYCEEKDILLPKFVVHSANPVGRENIKSYLTNFQLRQGLEIDDIK